MQRIAVLAPGDSLGSHLVPILLERFGCEIDAVDIDFQKLELVDSRVKRIRAGSSNPVWRTKSLLAARSSSH